MKAIEALKQINAIFSEYVAIAKDKEGEVFVHNTTKLDSSMFKGFWFAPVNYHKWMRVSDSFAKQIEFNSDDWTKCIVTLKDIKNEQA